MPTRQHAINWTNDDKFTDAYMRHSTLKSEARAIFGSQLHIASVLYLNEPTYVYVYINMHIFMVMEQGSRCGTRCDAFPKHVNLIFCDAADDNCKSFSRTIISVSACLLTRNLINLYLNQWRTNFLTCVLVAILRSIHINIMKIVISQKTTASCPIYWSVNPCDLWVW